MKKLKRVGWFCFAGCCCAALMLIGGERFQQTKLKASDNQAQTTSVTICPNAFYGQIGGIYFFSGFAQGADCLLPQLFLMSDTRMHQLGNCPDCPDPVITQSGHPVPMEPSGAAPVPQPDPLFSGVLR